MGQGGSISQNKSIILSNWIQMNKNTNIYFNKVTNQQIQRHQVFITNKKQLNSYVKRMEDQSALVCRLIYFHPKANQYQTGNNPNHLHPSSHQQKSSNKQIYEKPNSNPTNKNLLTIPQKQKHLHNHKNRTKSMTPDQQHHLIDNLSQHNIFNHSSEFGEKDTHQSTGNIHTKIYYVYTDRMIPIKQWTRQKIIQIIEAFKKLTSTYGLFKVREHCICENERKQVKIWINQNPVSNFALEMVENQEDMIADLAAILVSKKQKIAKQLLDLVYFDQVLQKMVALGQEYDNYHANTNVLNNKISSSNIKGNAYGHQSTGSTSSVNNKNILNSINKNNQTFEINKNSLQSQAVPANTSSENKQETIKEIPNSSKSTNFNSSHTSTGQAQTSNNYNQNSHATNNNPPLTSNQTSQNYTSSTTSPIYHPAEVNNFYNVFINTDTNYTVNNSLQNSKYSIINKGNFGLMIHQCNDKKINNITNHQPQQPSTNQAFSNNHHLQINNGNKIQNNSNLSNNNINSFNEPNKLQQPNNMIKKQYNHPISDFQPALHPNQQYSPSTTFGNTAVTIPIPSVETLTNKNLIQNYYSQQQNAHKQELTQNTSIMMNAHSKGVNGYGILINNSKNNKGQSNTAKNSLNGTEKGIHMNKPLSSYVSRQEELNQESAFHPTKSEMMQNKQVGEKKLLGPPPLMTHYYSPKTQQNKGISPANLSPQNQFKTQKKASTTPILPKQSSNKNQNQSQQQTRSKNNSSGDIKVSQHRQKLKTQYHNLQDNYSHQHHPNTNNKNYKQHILSNLQSKKPQQHMYTQNSCLTPTYQGRHIISNNNPGLAKYQPSNQSQIKIKKLNMHQFANEYNKHTLENKGRIGHNNNKQSNQHQHEAQEAERQSYLPSNSNDNRHAFPSSSKSQQKLTNNKSALSPGLYDYQSHKKQHLLTLPAHQFSTSVSNRNVVSQLSSGKNYPHTNPNPISNDTAVHSSTINPANNTTKKKSFPKYFQQKQSINKSVNKYHNFQKSLDQRQKSKAMIGANKLQKKVSPAKLSNFDIDRFGDGMGNFNAYQSYLGGGQKNNAQKNNANMNQLIVKDITKQVVPQVSESEPCSHEVIPAPKSIADNGSSSKQNNELHVRFPSQSYEQRKKYPSTMQYNIPSNKSKNKLTNELRTHLYHNQMKSFNDNLSKQSTRKKHGTQVDSQQSYPNSYQASKSNFLQPNQHYQQKSQHSSIKNNKILKKSNNTCFDTNETQSHNINVQSLMNTNPYFSHINTGNSLLVLNNKFMAANNHKDNGSKKIFQTDIKKRKNFEEFIHDNKEFDKSKFRNIQRHLSIDKSEEDNYYSFQPSYGKDDLSSLEIKKWNNQQNTLKKRSSHHQQEDQSKINSNNQYSRKTQKQFTFFPSNTNSPHTTQMPIGVGIIQQMKPYQQQSYHSHNKSNFNSTNNKNYSKKQSLNSNKDQQTLPRTTADQRQKRTMFKATRTSEIIQYENTNFNQNNMESQFDELHSSDPGHKIQQIAQRLQKQKQKLHSEAMMNVLQTKLSAIDIKQYPKFKKWQGSQNVYGSLINHNSSSFQSMIHQKQINMNKNAESALTSGFVRKREEVRSQKDKDGNNVNHDSDGFENHKDYQRSSTDQYKKRNQQKKIPMMVASQNLQSKKKIRKQVLLDMKGLFGDDLVIQNAAAIQAAQQQKQRLRKLQIKKQKQQQQRMLQNTSSKDLLIQQKVQKQRQKHAQLKSDLSKLFVEGM